MGFGGPRKGKGKEKGKGGMPMDSVGSSVQYFLLAIFTAVASGPLLGITIHQVCVTKCLLLRNIPNVGPNIDDFVLIVLFFFYVMINFVACCVVWSMLSRAARSFSEDIKGFSPRFRFLFNFPSIFGGKTKGKKSRTARSSRQYGYRKRRYVSSDGGGGGGWGGGGDGGARGKSRNKNKSLYE